MENVRVNIDWGPMFRRLDLIESKQNQTHTRVGELADTHERTRNELSELRQIVDDFIRRDLLAKRVQLAQTKLIDVRAQLQTEFGHYGEVRRLAPGLLQATDVGVVSTATMRSISEELMLTTPRYWLAPALVGLAAWIRDDRVLAERALAEALRRDNDKTSLFFALVLRRHQRTSATARWVQQYVVRQDPESLSREFIVVLDAVATGGLGAEARPLVMEHVDSWYRRVSERDDIREAQIERWTQLLDGMRTPVDAKYTILPAVSSTWSSLKQLYEGATVHGQALRHFEDLFAGEVQLSFDQRKRVDDILASLVTNFDVEELPARREEARLALIIEHEGDEVAANRAAANEEATTDERVDILTLITNAAFFPDKVGASKGTQRLATAMAHDWISEADGRLQARNDGALPAAVELSIEGWHGSVTDRATQEGLTSSLVDHIETETQRQIAAVKFTGGPLVAAGAAALAFLLMIITFASASAGGGVFFLLVAAAAGGWSYYQYSLLPGRRDALREAGERRKVTGTATLNGAIAETVDLRQDWEFEAAKAADLHAYINQLNLSSFTAGGADESRTVRV